MATRPAVGLGACSIGGGAFFCWSSSCEALAEWRIEATWVVRGVISIRRLAGSVPTRSAVGLGACSIGGGAFFCWSSSCEALAEWRIEATSVVRGVISIRRLAGSVPTRSAVGVASAVPARSAVGPFFCWSSSCEALAEWRIEATWVVREVISIRRLASSVPTRSAVGLGACSISGGAFFCWSSSCEALAEWRIEATSVVREVISIRRLAGSVPTRSAVGLGACSISGGAFFCWSSSCEALAEWRIEATSVVRGVISIRRLASSVPTRSAVGLGAYSISGWGGELGAYSIGGWGAFSIFGRKHGQRGRSVSEMRKRRLMRTSVTVMWLTRRLPL